MGYLPEKIRNETAEKAAQTAQGNIEAQVQLNKLEILDMKLESTPDKYNSLLGNRYTISGKIKNENDYAVEKIVIGIYFYDKSGNKIDQHNEEITNSVFEKSETNFEEKFDLNKVAPDSGYTYRFKLVDAKKR